MLLYGSTPPIDLQHTLSRITIVHADIEVDAVAGDETAAVGEDIDDGDIGLGEVRRQELEGVGVRQLRECGFASVGVDADATSACHDLLDC